MKKQALSEEQFILEQLLQNMETRDLHEPILPEQPETTKTENPVFNHPEIQVLYEYGLNISPDLIDQILSLPKKSLIEDLKTILNDSIERFSYFVEQDPYAKKNTFVFHALSILSELKAREELPIVLHILSQSKFYLEFYLLNYIENHLWMHIYNLGDKQIDILKEFMMKPGVHFYGKIPVSRALTQIVYQQSERREEILSAYKSIIQKFGQATAEDNVVDSILNGQLMLDLGDLQALELLPEIAILFEKEYVDIEMCGDLETVEHNMNIAFQIDPRIEIPAMKNLYSELIQLSRQPDPLLASIRDDLAGRKMPVKSGPKIGRNEPCFCGSGKKHKKCCLIG